jgi:hypothetical protein
VCLLKSRQDGEDNHRKNADNSNDRPDFFSDFVIHMSKKIKLDYYTMSFRTVKGLLSD